MVAAVVDVPVTANSAPRKVASLNRILLAVDGSQASKGAVSAVAALVKGGNAEVFVVHLPAGGTRSATDKRDALAVLPTESEAEVSVDSAVRTLRSLGARVAGAVYRPVEDVGRGIVESAPSFRCGLVTVGTGERGRRGSILLGGVARHVIHRADTSVLVVPLSCTVPTAFRRILVAVDGSTYSERAVELAVETAELTGAELVVLHVCGPHGPHWTRHSETGVTHEGEAGETAVSLIDRVVGEISNRGLTATGEVRPASGGPTMGHLAIDVLEAAAQHDCQMVVVGPRGQAGPELMLGSVTFQLVHAATVPVLIAR